MSNERTIIRAPRNHQYFMMCRDTAQDRNLSFDARGVLAYLLSKPDNWVIQISDLQQGISRNKVYKLLNELITAGYMEDRKRTQDAQGKFHWSSYIVHETPIKPYPKNHDMENHDMDNHDMENRDILVIENVVSKETETTLHPPTTRTSSDVQSVEKPSNEKPEQLTPVTDAKLSPEEHKKFVHLLNADFKLYKGRDMNIYHLLRGTSTRKGYKEFAFTEKPVTLEELQGFIAWYRKQYPNISLPTAPEKIASRVEEYRQTAVTRTAPRPVNDDPYGLNAILKGDAA